MPNSPSSTATEMEWYRIENIDSIDSPALVIYEERVRSNIRNAVRQVQDKSLLRPHVKTSKIAEVGRMMLEEGITKFKCATIAEAEMLAMIEAPDVLLAYHPVGPKAARLAALVEKFPGTRFSCLVDDRTAAAHLSEVFATKRLSIGVFIDLNAGMNRSGLPPAEAAAFLEYLQQQPALQLEGLHAYDGHIHDKDPLLRQRQAETVFNEILRVARQLEAIAAHPIRIVAGGSPTFPFYRRHAVECSPGTFVFWDWGYKDLLPDEPFEWAALVITRVVSIVDATTLTLDLGHKSVAAENPLPRVHFLNAPEAEPVAQSEEHLVVKVPGNSLYHTGDVFYGVPVHVCPTVALYDTAIVVKDRIAGERWKVIARDRKISI